MPAIITHDFFGRDLLTAHAEYAGAEAERQAFMLGCQGPDPLLYLVIDPRATAWKMLGCIVHNEHPSEFLAAMHHAINALDEEEQSIGLAFARGMLAHYALDRQAHPLVYAQQFALCNAGVPGLTRRDGSYVHAVIEASIDEVVLFSKRHETVRSWRPYEHILMCSDASLAIFSRMFASTVKEAHSLEIPETLFADAVKCFRLAQRVLYAPNQAKRTVLSTAERMVRRHSLFDAMTHHPTAAYVCEFDNHECALWENPFTGKPSTLDFGSLYQQALGLAISAIEMFEQPGFDITRARELTGDINFSGDPVAFATE